MAPESYSQVRPELGTLHFHKITEMTQLLNESIVFKPCPLCAGKSLPYHEKAFYVCSSCGGIFRNPETLLSPEAERIRYEKHNNNPDDAGYRHFVLPLVDAITSQVQQDSYGLDFGAGPGPVASVLLNERGYSTACYDPFFCNNQDLLTKKYDYVFCCEVIEHFYKPSAEFSRLFSLIRQGGSLFCMTHLYTGDIDFSSWYYKEDETHVFFYREQTIATITRLFGFSTYGIDGRVIRMDVPSAVRA